MRRDEGKALIAVDVVTAIESLLIVTDTIDFGLSGIKATQWVSVTVDGHSDLIVHIAGDYKHSRRGVFHRSSFVPTNKEGTAFLPVTGVELRIVVRVTNLDGSTVEINDLTVSWKAVDRRFVRGPSVALSSQGGSKE